MNINSNTALKLPRLNSFARRSTVGYCATPLSGGWPQEAIDSDTWSNTFFKSFAIFFFKSKNVLQVDPWMHEICGSFPLQSEEIEQLGLCMVNYQRLKVNYHVFMPVIPFTKSSAGWFTTSTQESAMGQLEWD